MIVTAEKIKRDTDKWIERNPIVYADMLRTAVEYARDGHHISISKLVEDVRSQRRLNGFTDGFRVNNNIRAELTRRMIDKEPILKGYMETRKSKVDFV